MVLCAKNLLDLVRKQDARIESLIPSLGRASDQMESVMSATNLDIVRRFCDKVVSCVEQCYDVVQCVPTRRGHQILYKGFTYVFKSKLQCGAEQWICSSRQKTEEGLPEWVSIYFTPVSDKEAMKCNLCEIELEVNAKSPSLVDHMKDIHRDIYNLHKDNPDSSLGFRVEFLQMNVLKDNDHDKSQPIILGEECETTTEAEAADTNQNVEDSDVINMQYVMLDTKRKHRRESGSTGNREARKRSWIWKYFDRLSNIVYRCNICNVVLSTKGSNTNNLNRHMRSKHPDIFKTEKFSEAMSKESLMDVSSEVETPYAIKTEEIYASNNDSQAQKTRRSWIWSYFDYVSITQAQCKLCRRHINHGGNATGNMNRHLKMIHHKTGSEGDTSWIWKVFEKENGYYTCKICQHQLSKYNTEADTNAITNHLKKEHGVVSGDQIITGTECDLEEN